jgi:hypothetical protein
MGPQRQILAAMVAVGMLAPVMTWNAGQSKELLLVIATDVQPSPLQRRDNAGVREAMLIPRLLT